MKKRFFMVVIVVLTLMGCIFSGCEKQPGERSEALSVYVVETDALYVNAINSSQKQTEGVELNVTTFESYKAMFDVMNVVYSKWFIQFEPFGGSKPSDWTNGKIEDIAEFYDYLRKPLSGEERESMQKLYPYYGAISIVDYVDDYLFDDTYVLLSEDGANILDDKGHPALQFIHGKVWVNNHAHVLKAKNGFSDASLYVFLCNMQM